MEHAHAHLVVADLLHRLNDRLGRALHVGLDHDRQLLDVLVLLGLGEKLFQRGARPGGGALFLGGILAVFGDLAGLALGLDDVEHVARLGRAVEAQNLDRHGRAGLFDTLAAVVDERADLAVLLAHHEDVALAQRAFLDEHGRDGAAAHVELRLDHGALGGAVGVGLELEDLGLNRDRLQEIVEPLTGNRRDLDILHIARHRLDHDLVAQQVGADLVGIRRREGRSC